MTPPTTLAQILERMAALDESMESLNLAECETLAESLEIKIDGYRAIIKRFEARAKEVAAEILQLQKLQKSYESKAAGLEYLLVLHMQRNGFDRLPGERYQVTLSKSESVEIDAVVKKPDATLYRRYPEFMRRSYEWDKISIKAGMAAGTFAHDNIRLKTKVSPVFGPRKEE